VINFHDIIKRAARNTADEPILAAPYPLSNSIFRRLIDEGVISGYVAESSPEPDRDDPFIRGWWVDRRKGIWLLRNCVSHTLLLLSARADNEISGEMLLEAGLKGLRRILFVADDGSITREIDVRRVILEKLERTTISERVSERAPMPRRSKSEREFDNAQVNPGQLYATPDGKIAELREGANVTPLRKPEEPS
jgi:hypothetical protein